MAGLDQALLHDGAEGVHEPLPFLGVNPGHPVAHITMN